MTSAIQTDGHQWRNSCFWWLSYLDIEQTGLYIGEKLLCPKQTNNNKSARTEKAIMFPWKRKLGSGLLVIQTVVGLGLVLEVELNIVMPCFVMARTWTLVWAIVDWLEKRFMHGKSFWIVNLLVTQLDCPEVTLCGWQDVRIQLLTNKMTVKWWINYQFTFSCCVGTVVPVFHVQQYCWNSSKLYLPRIWSKSRKTFKNTKTIRDFSSGILSISWNAMRVPLFLWSRVCLLFLRFFLPLGSCLCVYTCLLCRQWFTR